MNYFKKILRFALPYKHFAFLNIGSNLLYAFFSTLAFISLMPMLKVVFGNTEKVTSKPIYEGLWELNSFFEAYSNYTINRLMETKGESTTLLLLVALIISTFLLKNIFGYFALYFITFLRNGTLKDIRNALYNKIISFPVSYFSEKRKGDTLARISADVLEIRMSFLAVLELIVREPLLIIFSIIAMCAISLKLTIFVFIFIPIAGLLIARIGKALKKDSSHVQKEQGYFLSLLDETLNGLKIIKIFNAEKHFKSRFLKSTQDHYKYYNQLLHRQNLAGPASEFFGVLVITAVLWYGGRMVLVEDALEPETFLVYLGLSYNILSPAKAISKASYNIMKGNAAAERILEILEAKNNLKNPTHPKEKTNFETEVTFKNISFKYENSWIFKDFNLTIPKGNAVAVVGQSGSGKTTLANLLTRFYDVQNGHVQIDGCCITQLDQAQLRKLIGMVTQEAILFNDTIAGNLKIAQQDADEEAIINALKVANAWEFVKALPEGIHTHIGEGGNKLSGGQKQRISIARAVLKNPPIMILDEATSALDSESEHLVQTALERMMENRTTLIIAHRLSTIKNAHKIVVLDKGQIIETGTHAELIAKKGHYFNMVQMQTLGD